MRYELTKRVRFEAAHFLPDHDGKCAHMHGHSYFAEIVVGGTVLARSGPRNGMLIDMADLGTFFKAELEPHLDHQLLNETIPELYHPVTAENVAKYLLHRYMDGGFPVVRVTLFETATQSATVYA